MTGFEPQTLEVGSNHSINWATTIAYSMLWYRGMIQFDENDPFWPNSVTTY